MSIDVASEGVAPVDVMPRRLALSRRPLVVAAVAVVIAVAGVAYIASPNRSESTVNAYLQADSSIVAPKVRGLVAAVLVQHNQRVHRGEPLVRIDPEEFDARAASAAGVLQNAQAAVQAAQAALIALDSEEKLAGSTMRAAQSTIRSFDAQRVLAEADRKRYDQLIASGAVARRDAEQFQTAEVTAQASVEVDALPGHALTGHVESFAPGSGSQFSLLPFEPGTGNFTKIVQRVPVRIRFDAGQVALERLRPGLSSTVTVQLRKTTSEQAAR